ncbi:hypothetical protein GCM10009648_02620 [Tsukamurella spumae]
MRRITSDLWFRRQVMRAAHGPRGSTGAVVRYLRSCGIYRSALHPHTDRAGVRIPVLISGGAADRWTALYWHGLTETVPEMVTATVPAGRRVHQATGYSLDTRNCPSVAMRSTSRSRSASSRWRSMVGRTTVRRSGG